MYVCMYDCEYEFNYVLYVCMYVYMYVCMYVCRVGAYFVPSQIECCDSGIGFQSFRQVDSPFGVDVIVSKIQE